MSDLPPGRSLEETVAAFYRRFGALKVEVDVQVAGNQIDVYVHEITGPGSIVRTVVECKDHASLVGIDFVNEFAGIMEAVRRDRKAEKGAMVALRGFTKPARQAASANDIDLFTVDDLRARAERLSLVRLFAFTRGGLHIALDADGRLLSIAGHTQLDDDRALIHKLKQVHEFVTQLERLATEPIGSVVAVDITGTETAFRSWIDNPLYGAVLQANGSYVRAYRRRHGDRDIAVQRNFIFDPSDLTVVSLANLRLTLERHLKYGVAAGIIFRDRDTPSEVVADLANLADQVCLDYGRMEGQEQVLLDVVSRPGEAQFRHIRDRVAWTADRTNVDVLVTSAVDLDELIRALAARIDRKGNGV